MGKSPAGKNRGEITAVKRPAGKIPSARATFVIISMKFDINNNKCMHLRSLVRKIIANVWGAVANFQLKSLLEYE